MPQVTLSLFFLVCGLAIVAAGFSTLVDMHGPLLTAIGLTFIFGGAAKLFEITRKTGRRPRTSHGGVVFERSRAPHVSFLILALGLAAITVLFRLEPIDPVRASERLLFIHDFGPLISAAVVIAAFVGLLRSRPPVTLDRDGIEDPSDPAGKILWSSIDAADIAYVKGKPRINLALNSSNSWSAEKTNVIYCSEFALSPDVMLAEIRRFMGQRPTREE